MSIGGCLITTTEAWYLQESFLQALRGLTQEHQES